MPDAVAGGAAFVVDSLADRRREYLLFDEVVEDAFEVAQVVHDDSAVYD